MVISKVNRKFWKQAWFLFFLRNLKMPALGSHHSLHQGPQHFADIVNVVLGNGGPLLLHGGHQGVGGWVLVGLALSIAPDEVIKGRTAGRGQGPEVGHHARGLHPKCQQGLQDQFRGHGGSPGQAFWEKRSFMTFHGLSDAELAHVEVLGHLGHHGHAVGWPQKVLKTLVILSQASWRSSRAQLCNRFQNYPNLGSWIKFQLCPEIRKVQNSEDTKKQIVNKKWASQQEQQDLS